VWDLIKNMEKNGNIISMINIKKSFSDTHAVNGVSFEVKAGEVFGLLGPNGAGKTTTIKMILGLLTPDEGSISVMGLNPEKDELQIKQAVGYISEEPLLFKSLTPRELINFIISVRELRDPNLTNQLQYYLDSLGLMEYYDKIIATLSHGNKKKVQIISAFLHCPSLLIMDEPISGIDAKTTRIFKEMIELHKKRGGAVLFSTHIMEIAEQLCDRIAIINKGQIIALGSMKELQKRVDQGEKSLESIFLKLTDQDQIVNRSIENLRKVMI
jgi:ABC-2 type transport system ATP-binding protein